MVVAAPIAELIRQVADRMIAEEDDVVDEMTAAVIAIVPMFGTDPAIAAEVRASNKANLHRFLTVARHADEPPPADVPPEAFDIARTIVRRGIETDALFHGYRRGQEIAWRRWLEIAARTVEPGREFAAVLEGSLVLLFRYVDDVLSRVVAEAQKEREEILGGALARRAETARLILEDAPLDIQTASHRLGYELARRHTAVVLWSETARLPQGALESAAGVLAAAAGSRRPLTIAASASTLWVWISSGEEEDPDPTALRGALVDAHADVRAAMGPTERGMRGFRRSHEAAVAVHRLLVGHSEGDRLATYGDLEVTALAARDELRAAEFVAATLGPLAVDDANCSRLRETLRVFLEEADHAPRTAARLHTHRNTILHRIARATELLGHDVGDRRLALALALELTHRLGPRVLVRPGS
ncbi:MAG TPA: helix-turn-helix domain-containing protein [Nocardioidaceae bacterium]|nr:helix-turn-helix domain-containing protein [Nocardioidaceae bacterium]